MPQLHAAERSLLAAQAKVKNRAVASECEHRSSFGCDLLYEGNYKEWRQCIDKFLAQNGLEDPITDWQAARAADLISSHVQPALVTRVSAPERHHSVKLLQGLKRFCGTFRFLDLPAELRTRVYEHVFIVEDDRLSAHWWAQLPAITRVNEILSHQKGEIVANKASGQQPVPWCAELPAITRVNKLLRQEAFPLYYSNTTIGIAAEPRLEGAGSTMTNVRAWAAAIPPQMQKCLRRIVIKLTYEEVYTTTYKVEQTELLVLYKPSMESLEILSQEIVLEDGKGEAVQRGLREYAREVTANCRAVGFEDGRMIVMALLGKELWSPFESTRRRT